MRILLSNLISFKKNSNVTLLLAVSTAYMLQPFSQIEKFVKQRSHEAIMTARIISHAGFDKKKAKETQCDIIVLFIHALRKEQSKCHFCDELMTDCQGKGCLWQWSIDRIDNAKGHTMDNVRLTCFYCNVRQYGMRPSIAEARLMKRTKTCRAGCHVATVSRNDPGLANIGSKLKRGLRVKKNIQHITVTEDDQINSDVIKKELSSYTVQSVPKVKYIKVKSNQDDSILLSSTLSDDHPLKNTSIRIIMRDNKIFYYATDLCEILGITTTSHAINCLKPHEIVSPEQRKTHNIITYVTYQGKLRINNKIVLITERGVNRIIMNASGPIADELQDYIFDFLEKARIAEKERLNIQSISIYSPH